MKTRILIVEDEGLIALDLKRKLEQAGYAVPAIEDNAPDALLAVENLRPDLVLMDIRLRGPQDGIEAADQIRRQFRVPVMFVTAHADRETLDRARITEPFGYIVKPFHSVDFRAQIEMALSKHKMEQKLRVSEAWLTATFRNVADALIATDGEGKIAFMNLPAAQLTGWDQEASRGKPLLEVFEVFDERTDLPVVHPLDAVLDAIYHGWELGTHTRTFKLRKRGSTGSVLVEAELSANRDGQSLLGIIVVFRDVTERRRAEDRERRLEKIDAIALMATGLGRELAESQRQMEFPLTEIISRSQGHTLHLLGEVYKRCAHQQSLVQQLISLGNPGNIQTDILDLNAVLAELEAKFRKALGPGRSLCLNPEPGIPEIKVDSRELRESLLRLVADVRHALPLGGSVEISTQRFESADSRHGVQLAIRDTGKGIRAESKDRVFDPYYQSRPGNQSPGFSLALLYQFITLRGGTVEVESAGGNGVAYLLRFPAASESDIALKFTAQTPDPRGTAFAIEGLPHGQIQ
jgi:PAS domain S-box-containing protein